MGEKGLSGTAGDESYEHVPDLGFDEHAGPQEPAPPDDREWMPEHDRLPAYAATDEAASASAEPSYYDGESVASGG